MTAPPWDIPRPKPVYRADLDKATREGLWRRCGGLDEVTGERLPFMQFDGHHRVKKSHGRDDRACNLLAVGRRTHYRLGSHEQWALDHGFTVKAFGPPPEDVAVLLHCQRYVLLGDDFTYIDGETGVAL